MFEHHSTFSFVFLGSLETADAAPHGGRRLGGGNGNIHDMSFTEDFCRQLLADFVKLCYPWESYQDRKAARLSQGCWGSKLEYQFFDM